MQTANGFGYISQESIVNLYSVNVLWDYMSQLLVMPGLQNILAIWNSLHEYNAQHMILHKH